MTYKTYKDPKYFKEICRYIDHDDWVSAARACIRYNIDARDLIGMSHLNDFSDFEGSQDLVLLAELTATIRGHDRRTDMYDIIAACFYNNRGGEKWRKLAVVMANHFALKDLATFSYVRFLEKCGIGFSGRTYDCQSEHHKGDPIDLPDEVFPTAREVKHGMDPEKCLACQEDPKDRCSDDAHMPVPDLPPAT